MFLRSFSLELPLAPPLPTRTTPRSRSRVVRPSLAAARVPPAQGPLNQSIMMLRVLIALALALSCSAAPAFDNAPVSTQIADAIADVMPRCRRHSRR